MRGREAHSEARAVLLGAMACCVRGELETAIDLLSASATPDVAWGDVGVELVCERIEELAAAIGRGAAEVAGFVGTSGADVRARWVLQTACAVLEADDAGVRAGRAELAKTGALHNATSAAMAITALVHAEAGLLGFDEVQLAQRICLQEAAAQLG